MSVSSSLLKNDQIHYKSNINHCFHCGEQINNGEEFSCKIAGENKPMCCMGCVGVAEMIIESGLEDYYLKRITKAKKPEVILNDKNSKRSNSPWKGVQELISNNLTDDILETDLLIRGITCPACSWLCESKVGAIAGITFAKINYTTNVLKLRWNKKLVDLENIVKTINNIGYEARLYNKQSAYENRQVERKEKLQALGITAALGMQVMMISIALYFGHHSGMSLEIETTFNWINLFLASLVMFFSGKKFFQNAIRDLRIGFVSMDLAVALGLLIAFLASIYATIMQEGEVYFDTIVMFVFLLSFSRYVEFTLSLASLGQTQSSEKQLPLMATILLSDREQQEIIPSTDLKIDDIILIKPGEAIPADGIIIQGTSLVNEAMMTGESLPLNKGIGDFVMAGTINTDSPIKVKVQKAGKDTKIAAIESLIENAQLTKPKLTQISDKVASYFIAGVISIAILTILITGFYNTDIWLDRVIAILIVCCPCALSLAMPCVYASSIGRLAKEGIIFKNIDRLINLNNIEHIVFDKTGTCTEGKFTIAKTVNYTNLKKNFCLEIAAAIEQYSEHPISEAFKAHQNVNSLHVDAVENIPGNGLSALVNNKPYFIGSLEFIKNTTLNTDSVEFSHHSNLETIVFLANKEEVLASFYLQDTPRKNLKKLLSFFKNKNIYTYLCSGDNETATSNMANFAGFDEYSYSMLPEKKLQFVEKLQRLDNVAMIGDGINDAPTLAKANVSFSISSGTDLAQTEADAILLNNDLNGITKAFKIAKLSRKIIIQNITWAISYNVIALPIAISGLLTPWLAAIGMSISSLIVVVNADRIRREKLL